MDEFRVIEIARRLRRRGSTPRRRRGPDRGRRGARERLPVLAARLPDPDVPTGRGHVPLRSARDPRLHRARRRPSRDEEWVLHAASQDLACLREVGLDPEHIFDTELAARLLGMPRVGLGVRRRGAARHPPRQGALRRRLVDAPAAAGVAEVRGARRRTARRRARSPRGERLAETGKTDLAAQEFDAVLHREAKPAAAEPWRRLSGIHAMRSPRNLAVARELWLARDASRIGTRHRARVGWSPTASILAAAKALPARPVAHSPTCASSPGRASRTELDRWWSAIERGLTTDDLPAVRVLERLAAAAPCVVDAQPRGRRPAAARAGGASPRSPSDRHAGREPAHARPPASRRVASAGRARPPRPSPPPSRQLGARPWQVEATAQMIADAFVEASQSRSGRRDGRFVGSVNRFSALGSPS